MNYRLLKEASSGESATASFGELWRNLTGNPLLGSLALGGLAAGGTYFISKPLIKTIRNAMGMNDISDEDIEALSKDKATRMKLALLAGGGAGLLAAYLQADKTRPGFGLLSYNRGVPKEVSSAWKTNGQRFYEDFQKRKQESTPPVNLKERLEWLKGKKHNAADPVPGINQSALPATPLEKSGGLLPEPSPVRGIDYSRVVSVPGTASLFQVPGLSPYDSNFGTAVVNAAPTIGTGLTTMGGILDSARDKFKSKLDFAGIVDTGVKTMVSNAAATAFTNALDGFVGLPQSTRNKLITGGTWAGLVHALVN